MARIRSIKPEFPQSEKLGSVSRDARLLFILVWTIADDLGRARASSRMLASLLFPYDDDAPKKIGGWLDELESIGCIRRYVAEGSTYLDLPNWLKHQKIDHASQSKFPAFDGSSRALAKVPETLAPDQGSRIKDQGEDQGSRNARGARAASGAEAPDGFVGLWDVYPNKNAKQDALAAYRKLNPSAELLDDIRDHVTLRTCNDPQWLKDDGQYVPGLATFLRKRRWTDVYLRAAAPAPTGMDRAADLRRRFIEANPGLTANGEHPPIEAIS